MNEFRIAFDGFKADMHSGLDDLRGEVRADTQSLGRKIQANADKAMEEHEVTRRHVSRLTSMVRKLWEQVHGSDPPPPTGSDSDLSFARRRGFAKGKGHWGLRWDEPVFDQQIAFGRANEQSAPCAQPPC